MNTGRDLKRKEVAIIRIQHLFAYQIRWQLINLLLFVYQIRWQLITANQASADARCVTALL